MIAGDVVLFHGTSLMSKLIRWCTRDEGEPPTIASHVGIIVSDTEIVESLTKTTQRTFAPTANCWVYRKVDLTPEETLTIVRKARNYVGDKYGWLKVVAHALDHLIFRDHHVMRRLCFMDKYPICSWVVAFAYRAIGYEFGIPANEATPDDIWDWVTTRPDWRRV